MFLKGTVFRNLKMRVRTRSTTAYRNTTIDSKIPWSCFMIVHVLSAWEGRLVQAKSKFAYT